MRVCQACGRENADAADFCACGEYLRWEPTNFVPAVAPAASAPADVGPREAAGAGGGGAPARASAAAAHVADPNATLAPDALPTAEPAQRQRGGAASAEAPPGAAALMLRLPDAESAPGAAVATAVEPGARTTILGLIRNQSDVVDNFDLSVRGLPEGWWTVTPPTAYLNPYGSNAAFEQEVQIHLHPPRTPEAQARPWSFEVVAHSRAYEQEVAAAPATVTIGPYHDLATELRPERGTGRLKARFTLTVRNRANARAEVALAAEDTDGECQFRFAEPSIALEPGNAMECPFTVFPPGQIWLGRNLDRRFQVTATPLGVELPVAQPARQAVFRQRPWLPWWLAIVLPILIVAAVLIYSLIPKPITVPDLRKAASAFAAQKQLNQVGLQLAPQMRTVVDPTKKAGTIADQAPPPGTQVKKGSFVTLAVYGGSGQVPVPSVVGATPGLADQTLRASGLTLGAVNPQPLDPNGKIQSQIPLAGTSVAGGTAVAVFMAPSGVAAAKLPGKATAAGAAAGVAAGAAGAGAANAAAANAAAAGPGGLAAVAAQAGRGGIVIPALAGDPAAAAGKLSQLGLLPVPIRRLSTVPIGQVAGTVPAAGQKVAKGAQVDLLVSSGSPQLTYDDGQTVHLTDPTTGKPSGVIPSGPSPQVEAAWSRDGTRLVYSQAGRLVLAEPNVKGAAPVALTPPTAGVEYHDPAFAPTTKAPILAFVQRSGSGAQLCFATVGRFSLNPDCTSAAGFDLGGHVDWSPDGSTILVLGTKNRGANFGLLAFTSNVPFSTHAADWGHGAMQTNASVPGQGVFEGSFSPDGKRMALVSNLGSADFHLYIVPAGTFDVTPQQELPVRACQVSWRSDGQELAVMQPDGLCSPTATGTIVAVDPAHPRSPTTLASQAAHPAWQPVPTGG